MPKSFCIHDNIIEPLENGGTNKGKITWIDAPINEAEKLWPLLESEYNLAVHIAHKEDTQNLQHPCFYDYTDSYDFLIIRSVDSRHLNNTKHNVIIITDNLIVTLHEEPNTFSLENISRKKNREIQSTAQFALYLIRSILNDFIKLKTHFTDKITNWENQLVSKKKKQMDYQEVLTARKSFRRFSTACDNLHDALISWRDDIDSNLLETIHISFADALVHVDRIITTFDNFEKQIDALVQLHFAASAHEATHVMRILTVFTAIFLPLTLLAGLYGMNFSHMPFANSKLGFYSITIFMFILGSGLFSWFKSKKWL